MLCSLPALAQTSSFYAFGGVGTATSRFGPSIGLVHVGGGGEFVAQSGFGGGAELGYLAPWQNGSNGVGLLSLNGLYRFRGTEVVPFVTGGYSLSFRSSATSFGNIGGGMTWWRGSRGLRLELRDNLRDAANHWIVIRVGIAFH